ncbi:MAG TPA: PadR family transcriptional regulator [Candidatus Bathyarchaeia archaeon]|nr:PadR family transcriptional regulator [Candidatus Bathyarchaeia archaeon]
MNSGYLDREEPKDTSKAFRRLKKKISIDNLWIYILRLLQDKEMYGYELRESIKTQFGFEPATVTSYTILYKLEKDGLVTSYIKDNPEGRPDRKYYTLTEEGKTAMIEAKGLFKEILEKVFDKT